MAEAQGAREAERPAAAGDGLRCRACGSPGRPLFSKRGHRFAACDACGCRFVTGATEPVSYDESYFERADVNGYADYRADRDLLLENFARRVRWLRPFARGTRFLDAGAAYGFLVRAARDEGFEAVGLEPVRSCAAWARAELGVEMLSSTIEGAAIPPASLDVVTLLDVIEHVGDPALALRCIRRWLRPGGIVAIETGDCEGLLARVCGSRWYYYDPPQHLTFFSPASLASLFERTGFSAPLGFGHLGRAVSVRNFSFQLGRALGDGILGEVCRGVSRSPLGTLRFSVPDRGNAFITAARAS
ncbi:MAG: class I SAM-dependent methyltransferase [Deltaproteobacteria bacterium]|nr:class I SAM-dependent methyltransferase [Deltaproteobacteria bacterium]